MLVAAAGCSRERPPAPPAPRLETELRFVDRGIEPLGDRRLQRGVRVSLADVSRPVLSAARPFQPTLDCPPPSPDTRKRECEVLPARAIPDGAATILTWPILGRRTWPALANAAKKRAASRGATADAAAPHANAPDAAAADEAAAPTPTAHVDAAPDVAEHAAHGDAAHDGTSSEHAQTHQEPEQRISVQLFGAPDAPRRLRLPAKEAYFAKVFSVPFLGDRTIRTEAFEVPQDAVLRLGYGVEEAAWWIDSAPVAFRIVVERESGDQQDLMRRSLDPARRPEHRRWFDADVDLSDLAGERVRLRFITEPVDQWDARPSLPVWGDPRLLGKASEKKRRPSIVLVSLDTLRARSMSTYGYALDTTPNMTAFARRGALFEKAFTTFSNTLGSHMSMLTGLLPVTHEVRRPTDVLNPRHATLAEALRRAGWATAAFTEDALLDARRGFDRGFSTYYENSTIAAGTGDSEGTFGRALEWAGHHADEPFFLFVHTYEVHHPYEPPEEYRKLFTDGAGAELGKAQRAYEQVVRYLDDQVGRLLDGLYRVVPERDLLVVITADHGEEFYEHRATTHLQLFDEVMHIPLIMVWTGVIPPGERIATPVSLIDLPPTILSLVGVKLPNDVDGVSLVPLLTGEGEAPERHVVFGEFPNSPVMPKGGFVARSADVKCIARAPGGKDACYDLAADPKEHDPRSPDERPEFAIVYAAAADYRARSLAATAPQEAAGAAAEQEAPAQATPAPEPDERIERKLRALGYVE